MIDENEGWVRRQRENGEAFVDALRMSIDMLPSVCNIYLGAPVYDSFGIKDDNPAPIFDELLKKFSVRKDDVELFEGEPLKGGYVFKSDTLT